MYEKPFQLTREDVEKYRSEFEHSRYGWVKEMIYLNFPELSEEKKIALYILITETCPYCRECFQPCSCWNDE